MKQQIITEVVQQMLPHLDNVQLQQLQKVLHGVLFDCEVVRPKEKEQDHDNPKLIQAFIAAKRIEGCSEKTLKYYRTTIETMVNAVDKGIRRMKTEDLRAYLTEYQGRKQAGRVTIDNIRRILSSFFSWLEDEDYILKSPVRRIHKVKTASNIKGTYTDEELEKMRDSCTELRDLAMIDMLASTGMRIGEMVLLNRWISISMSGSVWFSEKGIKNEWCTSMHGQRFICKITWIAALMTILPYLFPCELLMKESKSAG